MNNKLYSTQKHKNTALHFSVLTSNEEIAQQQQQAVEEG
jgi:hypothetical protein